ncbi:hypothetical protein ACOSQ4_021303 [Xanthoceras sorbifolium]
MGEASLLPPLPSSTHKFLEQCAAMLPIECGVEIVGTLFGDGTLTASCCSSLVAVGRPCHDKLIHQLFWPRAKSFGTIVQRKNPLSEHVE